MKATYGIFVYTSFGSWPPVVFVHNLSTMEVMVVSTVV